MSLQSCKTILFVDYENTGKIDLKQIPDDTFVPFFLGAAQKSVPTEFLEAALKMRDRFQPVHIEGGGGNALDFHIAFYLGEYLVTHPTVSCIILSKDTGFDPLVRHLNKRGFTVRRAPSLADAFGTPNAKPAKPAKPKPSGALSATTIEPSPLALVLQWLKEMQPRTRPKKRKRLIAHLHSHFGKKISEADLGAMVDRLVSEKKISEVEGTLGYDL